MNASITGQTFQMNQIINIHQVVLFVGVSRSTIYEMMDENSPYFDPTFPKKVSISQKRIGWSAWEINEWIEAKLASRE
ncbi:AlpA family phage regulatory protein [Acinetobacter sp. ANC 3926]|uniref:Prophage regulatory protein n=1 Tax=Acinetobacter genomosp. 15BJ TaxID=106651 RepID=R9ATU5_9GAMM|nr:AlpA family phage regulatory protein [Acinetobacter genomosp. 15BJ]EOR05470.1 prophage regulatory protein [Acinetobacter genomosp. 15BJ]MCH7293180.1 AlpA family phage regulatory protein [Acinetobacter genomosp. 15BJ]